MLLDFEKSRLLMVDVQEKLLPAVAGAEAILRNGELLLKGAAEFTVPVVVSEQYPNGLGRTVPELSSLAGVNRPYEKLEFSCYANPALREALDGPGRQTVIFGIEAHVCVLQTAIEMASAGLDVSVVTDAVSSRADFDRQAALRRMGEAGVRLLTTEMVLFEWLRRAGTEPRSAG
jgi:nicotinamidase-related amidase